MSEFPPMPSMATTFDGDECSPLLRAGNVGWWWFAETDIPSVHNLCEGRRHSVLCFVVFRQFQYSGVKDCNAAFGNQPCA